MCDSEWHCVLVEAMHVSWLLASLSNSFNQSSSFPVDVAGLSKHEQSVKKLWIGPVQSLQTELKDVLVTVILASSNAMLSAAIVEDNALMIQQTKDS